MRDIFERVINIRQNAFRIRLAIAVQDQVVARNLDVKGMRLSEAVQSGDVFVQEERVHVAKRACGYLRRTCLRQRSSGENEDGTETQQPRSTLHAIPFIRGPAESEEGSHYRWRQWRPPHIIAVAQVSAD